MASNSTKLNAEKVKQAYAVLYGVEKANKVIKAMNAYVQAWNAYWAEVAKNKKVGILQMNKRGDMLQLGLFGRSLKEKKLKAELDKQGNNLEKLMK